MPEDFHFEDVWVEAADGQMLFALINGDVGVLMYLRGAGDAGFSSRNPDYAGPPDEKVRYKLGNGQIDFYPRAWAYPVEIVRRALEFFEMEQIPPTFVTWHNDSGDGRPIVSQPPKDGGRSARAKW